MCVLLVLYIKGLLLEIYALIVIVQFHICKAMTNDKSFRLLRRYLTRLNFLLVINNKMIDFLNLVIKKCIHTFKHF